MDLSWMSWTAVTTGFFGFIALLLLVMGVAEILYPTVSRKGWLPIATTRGDRVFIALLSSAFMHLAWLGFAIGPLYWASILCFCWMLLLLRYG